MVRCTYNPSVLTPCARCGKPTEAQRRNRKLCPECRKEKNNEWQRARYDPVKEQEYRAAHRGDADVQKYELKFRHGMTPAEREAMWDAQQGLCYLCDLPMTRPGPGRGTARGTDSVIEHYHGCCAKGKSCAKCRRGLAHRLCNQIIGQAGDDPAFLRLLADRLEQKTGGDASCLRQSSP